jgi:hypothetical protein
MPNPDYIPRREAELVAFLANLAAKLSAYASTFGITVAQITQMTADSLFVAAVLNQIAAAKAEAKEWVEYKDIELFGAIGSPLPSTPAAMASFPVSSVPPGIIQRVRNLANQIKNHPAYTAAVGEDLGLIAPVTAASGDPKPTGKATAQGNFQALIEWVKGAYDGVDIETQREGETTWTYLAFDSFSPYLDTRPPAVAGKPEVRRYRMRYRRKEDSIGLWSDVIEVLVGA